MKTYNLQLRTTIGAYNEFRNIQVQANSRQEAQDKIAGLSSEELKKLIAEIPSVSSGWSTQ